MCVLVCVRRSLYRRCPRHKWQCKLWIAQVHLSADSVFDGTKPPYSVDSRPNPLSEYGRFSSNVSYLLCDLPLNLCQLLIVVFKHCRHLAKTWYGMSWYPKVGRNSTANNLFEQRVREQLCSVSHCSTDQWSPHKIRFLGIRNGHLCVSVPWLLLFFFVQSLSNLLILRSNSCYTLARFHILSTMSIIPPPVAWHFSPKAS